MQCVQGSPMLWHVSVFYSFLGTKNIPLHGWTSFCVFICGHLGWSSLLAAVNICLYRVVSVWMYVFISLGYVLRRRIIGLYGASMCNSLRKPQTVSAVAAPCSALFHPHQQCTGLPVSPHPHPHLLSGFIFIVLIKVKNLHFKYDYTSNPC